MGIGGTTHVPASVPVGATETLPRGTPVELFSRIFLVFVVLGTLVGVVVIGYTLYNAYVYRDTGGEDEYADSKKVVRPTMGELPTGSGGGKKLFVSFGISAVIVLSLIVWTYSGLLYTEEPPETDVTVDVVGQRFSWAFTYPNGHTSTTLRVPANRTIELKVTSSDVFHNIGIPAFDVKADAIPGQTNSGWFHPEETGTYEAICYELCGAGHSQMRSDVIVMNPQDYQNWYANTTEETSASVATGGEA